MTEEPQVQHDESAREPQQPQQSREPRESRGVPKGMLVAVTAVTVIVLLASGGRTWVDGQVSDAVLATSSVGVSGRDAAGGVIAAALVAAAAMLAALTGGRIVRRIGAVALALAGVLVVALSLPVLTDAAGVVGEQAAAQTGRTGSIEATGSPTAWVIVALVAGAVLVLCGLAALVSARHWGGLTARYDSPAGDADADESDRATPQESDWDRLSRGEDPT